MFLVDTGVLVALADRRDAQHGDLAAEDLGRMAELVRHYSGLRLGGTDASVIAAAQRLGINDIATVDRRHFTVVRPRHVDAFRLWPAL